MSNIFRLSLDAAMDPDAQVAGWDQTIGDNHPITWEEQKVSIASHAVAHRTVVCGTTLHDPNASNSWITWKRSFAPHRVCRVACNKDGSIVAAAMDNGTVAVLKGSNGDVLATRRVASEGVRMPAEVSFVRRSAIAGTQLDTLVVEPPEANKPTILVSHIDSKRLNSEDEGIVTDSVKSIVFHELKINEIPDRRAIQGYYRSKEQIRFALVDGNGNIAIHDYNIERKTGLTVARDVSVGSDESENWGIDFTLGVRILHIGSQHSFLLFAASSTNETQVGVYDLEKLKIAGDLIVSKNESGNNRTRVLELEPVTSSAEVASMAMVVATTTASGKEGVAPTIETRVIQASVDEINGRLGALHALYHIPVPNTVTSMSVAPVPDEDKPYSFRCLTSYGQQKSMHCHEFMSKGSSLGSIRLLARMNLFEQANSIVSEIGSKTLQADSFARFHPSEISLQEMKSLLSSGRLRDMETARQSRACLQKLSGGALSGNIFGKEALLAAANTIICWPDAETLFKGQTTIGEVVIGLHGIIAGLKDVSAKLSESTEFDVKINELEERLVAMQYLQSIFDRNASLDPSFASVLSIKDLFACLVQSRYFSKAEQLWRSELQPKLSTEVMVTSMLGVSSQIDPREYATLLSEVIVPALSINHELLPVLLEWSCRMADDFDDAFEENGLGNAIFLLEILERGTKELRVSVHSSFASYTPFVDRITKKKRRLAQKNTSASNPAMVDISFSSVQPSIPLEQTKQAAANEMFDDAPTPAPTLLEIGSMKKGAQKSRARKYVSIDVVDEIEDCVESKLVAARCLKYARELGLDKTLISLRTYSSTGGVQFIAKDLVKMFSTSSRNHEQRTQTLATKFRSFCNESSVDADEAIKEYAQDLCGGNTTTKRAVEEAASLSQCCLATKAKCEVVLISLRAAKLCHFSPQWLSKLSVNAIEWAAGDSTLRSELEEASRLLLIEGIVGRYCGDAAKELFHVDNPRHAIRLVEFISHQPSVDESILTDTLALCDAFSHLLPEEACSRIIQNKLVEGDKEGCSALLKSLYRRNSALAKDTFSRVIAFCKDIIQEGSGTSSSMKKQAQNATSCAFQLSKIALTYVHSHLSPSATDYSSSAFDESRLQEMVEDFQHLEILQTKFGIFLSIVDLHDPRVLIVNARRFMEPLAKSFVEGDKKNYSAVVTEAKRVCSLLAGTSRIPYNTLWLAAVGSTACKLATESTGVQCLEFLSEMGVLESLEDDLSSRCCLALALTFCRKALKENGSFDIKSRMQFVMISNSLLRDISLAGCSPELLAPATATAELCDMTSQILVRADEGIGEDIDRYRKMLHTLINGKSWSKSQHQGSSNAFVADATTSHLSTLHPTWYVGDGLLLPPHETLVRGLEFCKNCLSKASLTIATVNLYTFLEGRGAHALALRVLTYSTTKELCQLSETNAGSQHFKALEATHTKNLVALTERSLGGSGNGILSGVVDSQLSGSFLLCLPLKKAFKVYKAALPTAMSTRDFERLIKLAGIGEAIGKNGVLLPEANSELNKNWKRQHKFVAQCHQLALRANWWKKLQSFDVQFDLYRFEEGGTNNGDRGGQKYPETLLPSLIFNMAQRDIDSHRILETAGNFAAAFGLSKEAATKRYIEFLLSPVDDAKRKNSNEVRSRLSNLEALVENLIRQLCNPFDRLHVLRNCLVRFEGSANCKDYERLSILLLLYRIELESFLGFTSEENALYKEARVELELIGRRFQALALLSSYFQVEKKQERPTIDKLFRPLPKSLGQRDPDLFTEPEISILGSEEKGAFDPLLPLEDILASGCDSSLTTLAPLCSSLGVPQGFLHARSLILRFKKSKLREVSYPSFEGDVLPVLQKLKSPDHKADLAEWCSQQYSFEDEDKLRSLDSAKNFAMEASSEAEKSISSTSTTSQHESHALDRLKRIRSAKELLVDRLAINAILNSVGIKSVRFCTLSSITDILMKRLDEQVWSKAKFEPERFIEIFLTEASLLSAEACLSKQSALSVAKFRKLCSLVHQACKSVAERYSHVHVGTTIRKLARQWLAHGDNAISSDDTATSCDEDIDTNLAKNILQQVSFPEIMEDEEDTMNFVMDLSSLKGETAWSANLGPSQNSEFEEKKYTSEEEPSCLRFPGSPNEVSEFNSRRAALRIAFVMAFTDKYEGDDHEDTSKENLPQHTINAMTSQNHGKPRKKGLLAKIGQTESEKRCLSVIEYGRELLRVVFAKSGSSETLAIGSFDVQKTVTFAMRHRALRAASILCPQEALEDVIEAEGFLADGALSSLKLCSFAAYVAKEIEELGLPLPHSDLSQLGTINFPSYARTLWRHHRDNKVTKGRLLLLIAEMYLKEPIQDFSFLSTVLTEVEKSNLPRSLLLILESAKRYLERIDRENIDSFFSHLGAEIMLCMRSLGEMVDMEYKRLHDAKDKDEIFVYEALATSKRLSSIAKAFSYGAEGQSFLQHHIESQVLLSERSQSEIEKKELLATAFGLLKFLDDSKEGKRLAEEIRSRAGNSFGLPRLVCLEDRSNAKTSGAAIESLSRTENPDVTTTGESVPEPFTH